MIDSRPAMPVIDAVNAAVGALTEVVRALRSSANVAKEDAKGRVRAAKQEIKRGAAETKTDIRDTLRQAWISVRHPHAVEEERAVRKGGPKKRRSKAKSERRAREPVAPR